MARPIPALALAVLNPVARRNLEVHLFDVWQIVVADRTDTASALGITNNQLRELTATPLFGTQEQAEALIHKMFGHLAATGRQLVKIRRATQQNYEAVKLSDLLAGFEEDGPAADPDSTGPIPEDQVDDDFLLSPLEEQQATSAGGTLVDNNSLRDPDPEEEKIIEELEL